MRVAGILVTVRIMVFPVLDMGVVFIRAVIMTAPFGMLMRDHARLIAEIVSGSEKELLGPERIGNREIPLLVVISVPNPDQTLSLVIPEKVSGASKQAGLLVEKVRR
jgi:hypothetical protein